MKRAVIFGGSPEFRVESVEDAEVYLCADAGVKYAKQLGICPDYVAGDFDSLGYIPSGKNVDIWESEKDDSDTMLCIKRALEMGCDEIYLYGCLGGRLDHTIANIQALEYMLQHGATGFIVDENHKITMQGVGKRTYLKEHKYLSLFAWTENCTVTLEGLKYTLTEGTLKREFPLGLSNEFAQLEAKITVLDGLLLIIYAKQQ